MSAGSRIAIVCPSAKYLRILIATKYIKPIVAECGARINDGIFWHASQGIGDEFHPLIIC